MSTPLNLLTVPRDLMTMVIWLLMADMTALHKDVEVELTAKSSTWRRKYTVLPWKFLLTYRHGSW